MVTYGFVLLVITAAMHGISLLCLFIMMLSGDTGNISSGRIAYGTMKCLSLCTLFTIFAVCFSGPEHIVMLIIGAVLYGAGLVKSLFNIASNDSSGCVSLIYDIAMLAQFIVVAALV